MNNTKLPKISKEEQEWKVLQKKMRQRHVMSFKIAGIVSIIALISILMNRSSVNSNEFIFFVFLTIFIIVYLASILLFKIPDIINEMRGEVDKLLPETSYLKRNSVLSKPDRTLRRMVMEWFGILLFIIVFDFFILLSSVIGYLILASGPLQETMLTFSDFIQEYIFSNSSDGHAILAVLFILFVLFPVMYSKRAIGRDPALQIQKISPMYVFNRIMILWLTLARGDDIRLQNRAQGKYGGVFFKKSIFALVLGIVIDLFIGMIAVTPILLLLAWVYVGLLYVYKIDPTEEYTHGFFRYN